MTTDVEDPMCLLYDIIHQILFVSAT